MCGIVGLVGPQEPTWIAAMNAAQHHRGPDDGGSFWCGEHQAAIAMRRLAIIDISGGAQPLLAGNGRYALVYNGEIFNAPELRRDLERRGITFVTDHSDTEVLLLLLIHEGARAVAKLNGMFAFAFLDREAGTLLLGRDRFGIKPLHYVESEGRFAFASEVKSLLQVPCFDFHFDQQSIGHYLTLRFVPGERTIYSGVNRLPAASILHRDLRTGTNRIERYWRLSYAPDETYTLGDWRHAIADALRGAVKRWAQSDVPLAVSLSGGLDSSAIAAYAALEGVPLRSVSLGFEGPDEAPWNELPLARQVARKWSLPHEEIALRPEALIDALPQMVASLDEPYAGGLPSWFVFQAMSRSVKVGLTGVGGDEMFGNYGKWLPMERRWMDRFGTRKGRDVTRDLFEREVMDRFYYASEARKRELLVTPPTENASTSGILFHHFHRSVAEDGQQLRDAWARVDIETQLSDEFLLMVDRFSMAHSLEARTPFLDNEFVDLVRRIPAAIRTRRRDLKGLLREAVAPVLPTEIINSPKSGFVIPTGLWMRGRLRPLVEDLLGDRAIGSQGIFRKAAIAPMRDAHLAGTADHSRELWPILMFQMWAEQRS